MKIIFMFSCSGMFLVPGFIGVLKLANEINRMGISFLLYLSKSLLKKIKGNATGKGSSNNYST